LWDDERPTFSSNLDEFATAAFERARLERFAREMQEAKEAQRRRTEEDRARQQAYERSPPGAERRVHAPVTRFQPGTVVKHLGSGLVGTVLSVCEISGVNATPAYIVRFGTKMPRPQWEHDLVKVEYQMMPRPPSPLPGSVENPPTHVDLAWSGDHNGDPAVNSADAVQTAAAVHQERKEAVFVSDDGPVADMPLTTSLRIRDASGRTWEVRVDPAQFQECVELFWQHGRLDGPALQAWKATLLPMDAASVHWWEENRREINHADFVGACDQPRTVRRPALAAQRTLAEVVARAKEFPKKDFLAFVTQSVFFWWAVLNPAWWPLLAFAGVHTFDRIWREFRGKTLFGVGNVWRHIAGRFWDLWSKAKYYVAARYLLFWFGIFASIGAAMMFANRKCKCGEKTCAVCKSDREDITLLNAVAQSNHPKGAVRFAGRWAKHILKTAEGLAAISAFLLFLDTGFAGLKVAGSFFSGAGVIRKSVKAASEAFGLMGGSIDDEEEGWDTDDKDVETALEEAAREGVANSGKVSAPTPGSVAEKWDEKYPRLKGYVALCVAILVIIAVFYYLWCKRAAKNLADLKFVAARDPVLVCPEHLEEEERTVMDCCEHGHCRCIGEHNDRKVVWKSKKPVPQAQAPAEAPVVTVVEKKATKAWEPQAVIPLPGGEPAWKKYQRPKKTVLKETTVTPKPRAKKGTKVSKLKGTIAGGVPQAPRWNTGRGSDYKIYSESWYQYLDSKWDGDKYTTKMMWSKGKHIKGEPLAILAIPNQDDYLGDGSANSKNRIWEEAVADSADIGNHNLRIKWDDDYRAEGDLPDQVLDLIAKEHMDQWAYAYYEREEEDTQDQEDAPDSDEKTDAYDDAQIERKLADGEVVRTHQKKVQPKPKPAEVKKPAKAPMKSTTEAARKKEETKAPEPGFEPAAAAKAKTKKQAKKAAAKKAKAQAAGGQTPAERKLANETATVVSARVAEQKEPQCAKAYETPQVLAAAMGYAEPQGRVDFGQFHDIATKVWRVWDEKSHLGGAVSFGGALLFPAHYDEGFGAPLYCSSQLGKFELEFVADENGTDIAKGKLPAGAKSFPMIGDDIFTDLVRKHEACNLVVFWHNTTGKPTFVVIPVVLTEWQGTQLVYRYESTNNITIPGDCGAIIFTRDFSRALGEHHYLLTLDESGKKFGQAIAFSSATHSILQSLN